ncbi:S8 family peptidase [Deinococcus sp.]|uniref:S8 family peptidase n=1 Tax=Deinococcus sp. TaxID=47478 RepID=UPI003C7E8654
MRKPRLFATASTLALLTAALVSCGGQTVPQAQGTPAATASTTGQTDLVASGQIVSVSVRPGTTEADLASRYPTGKLLDLHASEGYAQLWVPTLDDAAPRVALGALSLNAQAVTLTAVEPDAVLNTGDTQAQGNGVWAGGNGVWAGGASVLTGGIAANTFIENASAWNLIDLAGGQKLAPTLGKGVSVAVLDTGIDINHPAFAGHLNVTAGWDYVGGDATPQEENAGSSYGHGTAVAGVILQVAPNVTIIPFRVLNPGGQGKLSNVIMAINDAVKCGAKVINMSLGSNNGSAALSSALESAIRSGVMVVASSGNTGDDKVTYPARYSADAQANLALGGGLLSVGSESLGKLKSKFSTYGIIDLVAPGELIRTTYPANQVTNATGTSFAAPIVSGAVALGMSTGFTDVIAISKFIRARTAPTLDATFLGQLGGGSLNVSKLMGGK